MDNNTNTDETKKLQEDLDTAQRWLGDAREWIKLAEQLNSESTERQNSNSPEFHKLNVAHVCTVLAFQLAYNSLLVAEAKWPREKDGVEKTHRRLQKETQSTIEGWIRETGNDNSNLLKNLDNYMNEYGMESALEDGNHQFNTSALATVLDELLTLETSSIRINPLPILIPSLRKSER